MSRRITLLLHLVLIGSILAACGAKQPTVKPTPGSAQTLPATPDVLPPTNPPGSSASTATPPPSIAVDPAKLKGVKVVFWHAWSGKEDELLQSTITRFNLTNPWGIYVEPRSLGGYTELFQDVNATLMTPQMPDLLAALPEQALAWEAEQPSALIDLNLYVTNAEWGLTPPEQADFPIKLADQDILSGKRAGIPAQRSLLLLYYNATWAKELGYTSPPSTPDEFKTQVCAAARANQALGGDKAGTGGWIINTDPLASLAWIAAFGGELWQAEKDAYFFTTPAVQKTFDFLRNLVDLGCIWPAREPYPQDYFASRKALIITAPIEDIPLQTQAMTAAKNADRWTVLPFPSLDGKPVVFSTGVSYYILKSTPERQMAAWLFLKSLSNPEFQAKMSLLSGDFPVRTSALDNLSDFRKQYPQWDAAIQLLPYAQTGPQSASWRTVRNILEDAAAQIYQPETKPDQVRSILLLLQSTTDELLLRQGP